MPFTLPADQSPGQVASASWADAVNAGLQYLANPPACHVYNTGTPSISNTTNTVLAMNAERYDTDTMHDTVTNNSRITIKTAGLYVVGAAVLWPANATGGRTLAFLMNGANLIGTSSMAPNPTGGQGTAHLAHVTWKFAVNDYIEVRVFQASGGALVLPASSSTNGEGQDFWATWVGLG